MKEPATPVRSSARIQERIGKAVELARARARENLLNPPKTTIGKKPRKRKNWSRRSSIYGTSPLKKQRKKAVKPPNVVMGGTIQEEDTVNQGLLDSGVSALNMQEMRDVPTATQPDTAHLHNQQEPYGQQQGVDCQNWRSPTPNTELSKSWEQSGCFYRDPDGYYWLE